MNGFDEHAKNYHKKIDHSLRRLVDSSGDYFIQKKCDLIEELVKEISVHVSSPVIVDIGCGIGDFERLLPDNIGKITALDLSYQSVKVAFNHNPSGKANFGQADAVAIPLPDSFADLVFISCVFHHLSGNSLAVLAEMVRICKPGCLIVCFEHNPFNPLTQLVVRTTPLDKNAQLVSHQVMCESLSDVGVEIIDRRFFLFAPKKVDNWIERNFRFLSRL